jgi:septal ring factor EnvC (AmiA/AmiB activator)
MSSGSLLRSAALALLLACFARAGASAQTQSGSPVTTGPSVVTLSPMITSAPSFMAEIQKHIADSSTLASMSSRDRYLQLQKDNRYLRGVLNDQDRRLDALEKRLAALKTAKAKMDAEAPDASSRDRELESALSRAERLSVPPGSVPPQR